MKHKVIFLTSSDRIEVTVENSLEVNKDISHKLQTQLSYRTALSKYRSGSEFARFSWVTWSVLIVTLAVWWVTAYVAAQAAGVHTISEIITIIASNAINIQDRYNDVISNVVMTYGAKDNGLILRGQYWRFVTTIFLHANALHVGLNMLNFFVLGIFLERLFGHMRFLLIYLLSGIISIIASFYFSPQDISVGASGAIFGLVGAYSIFVLVHRQAFPRGGIPAMLWLIIIIGINLSIGLFVSTVDNYAHIGGLLSGALLGWWFAPLYKLSSTQEMTDMHSLSRRWPLAIVTILATLVLAIIAVYHTGG